MMHKSMCGNIGPASVKQDVTLKDYIERKQYDENKKLTFEEWWEQECDNIPFEDFPEKAIWKAAQENK